MQISDEMIEAGCIGMYGKNWNGPEDKRPGEDMKNVWRRYARDCLTAALALSGWRTIDSAPDDGTKIIYHNGSTVDPVVGQCRWSDWSFEWSEDESPDACWWDYERDQEASPAFWMPDIPLPAPPATQDGKIE